MTGGVKCRRARSRPTGCQRLRVRSAGSVCGTTRLPAVRTVRTGLPTFRARGLYVEPRLEDFVLVPISRCFHGGVPVAPGGDDNVRRSVAPGGPGWRLAVNGVRPTTCTVPGADTRGRGGNDFGF